MRDEASEIERQLRSQSAERARAAEVAASHARLRETLIAKEPAARTAVELAALAHVDAEIAASGKKQAEHTRAVQKLVARIAGLRVRVTEGVGTEGYHC